MGRNWDWPPHILSGNDLTDDQRNAIDVNTLAGYTTSLHLRNAFAVLVFAVKDHPARSVVALIPENRPRMALDAIQNHFYPKTPAGVRQAMEKFMTSTMANTHTTLTEWGEKVQQHAQTARALGMPAGDQAQLSVLLAGLLPEFEPQKLILDNNPNLTFTIAFLALKDFANARNLSDLAKGKGGTQGGAKTFNANANNNNNRNNRDNRNFSSNNNNTGTPECRKWKEWACSFKGKCKFQHVGPGGYAVDTLKKGQEALQAATATQKPAHFATPATPTTATYHATEVPVGTFAVHATEDAKTICYACCQEGHLIDECPAAEQDQRELSVEPKVLLVDAGPSRRSPLHGLLTWFLTLLTLCVAGVCAVGRKLQDTASAVTMPSARTITFAIFMLAGAVHMAAAFPSNDPKVTCYFGGEFDSKFPSDGEWIFDSGSNRFVTNDVLDFVPGSVTHVNTRVATGKGYVISPCVGTVMIRCAENGSLIECTKTLLLPECEKKLMPIQPFLKKKCSLIMSQDKGVILLLPDGKPLMRGDEKGGLYYWNVSTAHQEGSDEFTATPPSTLPSSSLFGLPVGRDVSSTSNDFVRMLTETHCALGHMNFTPLRKLLGLKPGPDPACPTCAIAGQKKESANLHVYIRAKRPIERMHIDIAYTQGSENPFQLSVDDHTRVSYLDLLESKADTLTKFQELEAVLKTRYFPLTIAFVRTDNEYVYTSNSWISYCRDTGKEHEYSPRYRHDGNGVVERAIGVVGKTFRCLMIQGGAPDGDIPNALVHANTIRNNTPTKANNGWTPKEKDNGMKLGLNKRLLKGPIFCLCSRTGSSIENQIFPTYHCLRPHG